jgi:hypothetical protein
MTEVAERMIGEAIESLKRSLERLRRVGSKENLFPIAVICVLFRGCVLQPLFL